MLNGTVIMGLVLFRRESESDPEQPPRDESSAKKRGRKGKTDKENDENEPDKKKKKISEGNGQGAKKKEHTGMILMVSEVPPTVDLTQLSPCRTTSKTSLHPPVLVSISQYISQPLTPKIASISQSEYA